MFLPIAASRYLIQLLFESNNSSALDDSKDYCNESNNQQNVNDASDAVGKKSDSPGYNQDHC
jgi:hypothetical protein